MSNEPENINVEVKAYLERLQRCDELINLVQLAYDQFEFSKIPLVLPTEYTLVCELFAAPAGFLSTREAFGFIARKGNTLKIIYRGTDSWGDWFTDSRIDQVEHRLGMVHRGGWDLYSQMAADVKAAVDQHPNYDIDISGHSLGCWPAIYTAADLYQRKINPIVFAPPRPGNAEFAENLNRLVPDLVCLINSEDMVPTLPLPVMGERVYSHAGNLLVFTYSTGSDVKSHELPAYQKFVSELLAISIHP